MKAGADIYGPFCTTHLINPKRKYVIYLYVKLNLETIFRTWI